jgi:predicted component of type VI protein secretion system
MRTKLNQLLSKMEGNDKLEKLLNEVIGNTEKAQAMKSILQEGEGK